MTFINRAEDLRAYIKKYPGDFDKLYLYREMANINDGIAEILESLKDKPVPICEKTP